MSTQSFTVTRNLRALVRSLKSPWTVAPAHARSPRGAAAAVRKAARAAATFENLEGRTLFSTFTVVNNLDAGAGSLRTAIEQANATAGPDEIAFNFPGGASTTITPATSLPAVTDTVSIDGTTQPGFTSTPFIRLSGETLAPIDSPVGIHFAAGSSGSSVRGLSINRFDHAGIEIDAGVTDVTVAGNWIGLTDDGTGSFVKAQVAGVLVEGSGNTIGGTDVADRNVISGNQNGIALTTADATGNVIQGNFIGTSANGTGPVGNEFAGVLVLVADHNTIGGTAAGAGNVIADNGFGVVIANSAHENAVQGNTIGLNVDGEALGNKLIGVEIKDADHNTIGGTTAASGNVISANGVGVEVIGAGSTNNVVARNFVGTDVNGITTRGNLGHGIEVGKSAANNLIGGAGAGNVISGNGGAGLVFSSGASHNTAAGNFIGTSALGFAEIHNVSGGVFVDDADDNVIGGAALGEGNLISGNGGAGVLVVLAQRTSIQGNRIGTDAGGTSALGNVEEGILVGAGSLDTTIGGTAPGAGNLISGNSANVPASHSGITVSGTTTNNTVIQGNLIGTDITGSVALSAGQFAGVTIQDTASNGAKNLIGGDTPAARNIISGNKRGVFLDGANDVNIFGNYIGSDATGNVAVPNLTGVEVVNTSEFTNIGNHTPGNGNLISGNTGDGVLIGAPVNFVNSNRIGTNAAGNAKLPNGAAGVHIAGNGSHVDGNLISGNKAQGLRLDAGSTDTIIVNNRIGTNADGTAGLGNGAEGILVNTSNRLRIGGPDGGSGNLVSGNGLDGISLHDVADSDIKSNLIGTNAAGTAPIGNARDGLFITGRGSNGNRIGGASAASGNVVSGNGVTGIDLTQAGTFNRIQGNKVGTDVTGTAAISNLKFGVRLADTNSNLVGGSVPEAANVIAFNFEAGVKIDIGNQNAVRQNSIFSNHGLGIDLAEEGLTPNDPLDADTVGNNRQNFPVLTSAVPSNGDTRIKGAINSTPNKLFALDFYANTELDGVGGSEGREYLGSATVTTDANGNASFDETIEDVVPLGQFITATASTIDTDVFVDTSEFSAPRKVTAQAPALPTLSVNDVTVSEGNSGTKLATFTVSRTGDTSAASTVTVATADGTAHAGSDYVALPPTVVSFDAGQTSKTVSVTINGDTTAEPAGETFTVNLSAPVGAVIADGQGVGTITDDEPRLSSSGLTLKANKQRQFTGVVASFNSADFTKATDFAAAINWGDGTTSAGQITFNSTTGRFEVIGAHKYAKKGAFQMLTVITDANGVTTQATGTMTV